MFNPFKSVATGLADVGKFIAHAVAFVMGTAKRVEYVLTQGKPLEKPFVSALSTVVSDLEAVISDAGTAVTADGLNFAADTAAYQKFMQLIQDFKALAPIAEDALAILEGNPEPFPQAAQQAASTAHTQAAVPVQAGPGLAATVNP